MSPLAQERIVRGGSSVDCNVLWDIMILILAELIIISIYLVCIYFLISLIRGKKLSDLMKKRILTDGLYHVTNEECIQSIVTEDKVTILPSGRSASYSNGFKKSSFFFMGVPTTFARWFNLRVHQNMSEKLVAIYIAPEHIDEVLLNQIKYRSFDKACMITGSYEGKGEVVTICLESGRALTA